MYWPAEDDGPRLSELTVRTHEDVSTYSLAILEYHLAVFYIDVNHFCMVLYLHAVRDGRVV